MCTAPADRVRAEAAISSMYSAVEEAPPQFVWCDSPIAIHLAMHIVGPTGSSVQRTLEVQLGNPVERMLLNGLAFRKMELTREVPTRMLNAAGRNPAWTWLVGILDGLMGIQLTYLVVTHQKIPGGIPVLALVVGGLWLVPATLLGLFIGISVRLAATVAVGFFAVAVPAVSLWTAVGVALAQTLLSQGGTILEAMRSERVEAERNSYVTVDVDKSLHESLWASFLAAPRVALDISRRARRSLLRRVTWTVPYVKPHFLGQQEASWIAVSLLARDIAGVRFTPENSKRLDMWAEIARCCMWWYPFHRICFVCERPAEIHMVDEDRLHNDSGPAVRFRDDWSIWSINGVLVDEQVVLRPATQTIRQIRHEQNVEVKRIRIERFGWDRYLTGVGAVAIDHRRNDVEATQETLMRTPDEERVLVCACPSTAKIQALPVPPWIRTCEEAQDWLRNGTEITSRVS